MVEHLVENTNYRIVDDGEWRYLMPQDDDSVVYSAMVSSSPDELVVPYTAAMMRFVLFKPDPQDIVLIGLGGGQQAKYILNRLPQTRLVALEVDPAMVRIARNYFGLPENDNRLSVVIEDGGAYVARNPDSCDVILSDGYEQTQEMASSLSSEEHYRACWHALRPGGMLAINLFRQDDAWKERYIRMLMTIFSYVLTMPVNEMQMVLLVFKEKPSLDQALIAERASRLEASFRLDLPQMASLLAKLFDGALAKTDAEAEQATCTEARN